MLKETTYWVKLDGDDAWLSLISQWKDQQVSPVDGVNTALNAALRNWTNPSFLVH
jgi:hypothetical protein